MASIAVRLVLFAFFISIVQCRMLRLNSSDNDFISDGTDHLERLPSIPNACNHQYGFLPCAENAGGYVFQILVYQGLLLYGGNLIGKGSKVLFDIMGVGKVGGIVFRILMSLPSMILMIVSGVFSSKECAQSMVSVGVGINAGITVFSLTFQWAICVMYGRKRLPQYGAPGDAESETKCLPAKKALLVLKDTGVTIDEQTQTTAGVMLLSLIPYIILQLDAISTASNGTRVVTLISLIVSALSLIAYFIYQERSLHYSKHEILRTEFLKYVQQQGRLMNEKGELNTEFVKKLFADVDKDHNNSVSNVEMETLVLEIIGTGKLKIDQKFAVSEIMKTFDGDGNSRIGEEEFIAGCKRWIEETPQPSENSDPSKNIFHELLTLFKENKEDDPRKKELVVSKILKHAETELLKSQSLVTADGKPNDEQIKALFRKFDSNEDNSISKSELENLLKTVKFGETQLKYEDVLHDLFKDFDTDNNDTIDEPEFVAGLKKYVDKAIRVSKAQDKTKAIDEYHDIVWTPQKYTEWDFFRSIIEILFGIVMLTFLGGPLMTSILQLSYAMSLPSFCISFVIVPLAMNTTAAFKAILPSRHKTEFMASLTFSEIYGGVIMNNVSGMTALLAIVLAKGLTFDFSAEVLTVLVVCAIIGILAYSRRSYPIWSCVLALFLYPFSLALFYFVQIFLNWN